MKQTETIKVLLENSILFTEEQKQSWLRLMPKMNSDELSELFAILRDEVRELKKEGINLIDDPALESELDEGGHGASIESLKAAATHTSLEQAQSFAKELNREVTTPELQTPTPEPRIQTLAAPKPPVRTPVVVAKPTVRPLASTDGLLAPMPDELRVPMAPANRRHATSPTPSAGLKSLMDIKAVDDLKKVQPEHLRQGELRAQIDMIKAKIVNLAQTNKILPYYTVAAFEESPLYKAYLNVGANLISDTNPDRSNAYEGAVGKIGQGTLTIREFEAVADLRKQIEQL